MYYFKVNFKKVKYGGRINFIVQYATQASQGGIYVLRMTIQDLWFLDVCDSIKLW